MVRKNRIINTYFPKEFLILKKGKGLLDSVKKVVDQSPVFIRKFVHKLFHSKQGKGVLNWVINNLPVPLHAPGFNFLGPGTKDLDAEPTNDLDALAKEHDIFYHNEKDLAARHKADKKLEDSAWEIVKSNKYKPKVRIWAYVTTNLIKTKRKLGMGLGGGQEKKRKALLAAVRMIHQNQHTRKRKRKRGGILPLLPILAALGTAGTIGSNISSVVKTLGDVKNFATDLFRKKSGSGSRKKTGKGIGKKRKRKRKTRKTILGNGVYLNPPPQSFRRR